MLKELTEMIKNFAVPMLFRETACVNEFAQIKCVKIKLLSQFSILLLFSLREARKKAALHTLSMLRLGRSKKFQSSVLSL